MTLGPSVAALPGLSLPVREEVGVACAICHVYLPYADFEGFEVRSATEIVNVIEATNDRPQWVSLECAIKPGSFPKPIIEWIRQTDGEPDEAVVEDLVLNTIHFVDDGRYLILETTSDAITDKAYYCRVTNPEFTAGRAPTTYTFNNGQLVFSIVTYCILKC